MPFGTDSALIRLIDTNGLVTEIQREIAMPDNERFTFALVDLTVGRMDISSSVQAFFDDTSGNDGDILDGRLAIFHKRMFADGTRFTIAADTRERPLEELFSGFLQRDPRGLLRRLEPEQSWPVFGDDSTLTDEAPTSGRLFVKLERENGSRFLWGDFQTRQSGTDLIQYSRSLYGAEIALRTDAVMADGSPRGVLQGFVADPGTATTREEFRGTGGTVYFLRRQDVAQGSERLFVEERDRQSGIVTSRRELIAGRDYDVNYVQGRVYLRQPLASTAGGAMFVQDDALSGNPVWLVATYEYVPGLSQPDTFVFGGRASWQINERIEVGLTGYNQGGDDEQKLEQLGGDVTFRFAPGSYARLEMARSDGQGVEGARSATGGYSFAPLGAVLPTTEEAYALRSEVHIDFADVVEDGRGHLSGYFQTRDAGFAGPGQVNGLELVNQLGVQLELPLDDGLDIRAKADLTRGNLGTSITTIEAGFERRLQSGWRASLGARMDDRQLAGASASQILSQTGSRLDAAVTIGYSPSDRAGAVPPRHDWDAYVFAQVTLDSDSARPDNDRYGLGGSLQLTPRMRLSAELSDGDLDFGAKAGIDYDLGERSNLYLSYTLAAENPDLFEAGRIGKVALGARVRYSDALSVFGEGRMLSGDGATGITQTYGIQLQPGRSWSWGLNYEVGTLSDPAQGDIDREAISVSGGYTADRGRMNALIERRTDASSVSGDREIWAWRLATTYDVNDSLRAYVRYAAATTGDTTNAALRAEYTEAVAALAWRPVDNDRLNVLFKYTFLSDQASPEQFSARGVTTEFAQRSHVLALDATWDVNGWLSVGGRVAERRGELRMARDASAPWFESSALLVSGRVDVNFVKSWDAMFEARLLRVRESESQQLGYVAAVYRQLTDKIRLGVGYSFSDFSDDLTDLNGDARGPFINLGAAF